MTCRTVSASIQRDPGDGLGERSRREAEREPLDALEDEREAGSECSAGQSYAREHEEIAPAGEGTQRRGESQVGGDGQARAKPTGKADARIQYRRMVPLNDPFPGTCPTP